MKHLLLTISAILACLVSSAQPQAKFTAKAYHYLEDEHPLTHQPLGTFKWYKQDEAVSFAILPRLTYLTESDGINRTSEEKMPTITNRYNLNGQPVSASYRGVQIQKMSNGKARKIVR